MSKRMAAVAEKVDASRSYTLAEAIDLLQSIPSVKFDETVELHVRLGIDPKQSAQIVRSSVVLPHGTGKSVRICVLTRGEKAKEAEAAGADVVGADDVVEKITKGWMEFDVLIATPDMMKDIAKLGKVLGPRGLMPNPKTGTVTNEIAQAVTDTKKGRVEFRNDDYGIVHTIIGKKSFSKQQLLENATALMDVVVKMKPAQAKGEYLRSVTLSSTMGPGITVDPAEFLRKK